MNVASSRAHARSDWAAYFIGGNGKPGEGPGCMVHNTGDDFSDDLLPTTASDRVSLAQASLR